jgi:uncharacterized protein YkwD
MRLPRWQFSAALLALSAVTAAWIAPASRVTAQAGQLDGDVPHSGAALIVWGGGPPSDLVSTAEGRGCSVASVWIALDGDLLVYIDSAPALVNEAFDAYLDGGSLPSGTAAVIVCSGPNQQDVSGGPAEREPAATTALATGTSLEAQFASTTFAAINQARATNGLSPLTVAPPLQRAAGQYAQLLLASGGSLDHFMDGAPWDRAQRAGYPSSVVGEVIASAANSEPLEVERDTEVLLDTWMNSPPHRDLLMGKDFAFTDLGVGCAVGHDPTGLNLVLCVAMTGQP